MQVSSKAYRIWRILFEHPNEWLDLSYLGHEANMSNRQASTVIQTMGCPNIKRRDVPPDRVVQICLDIPEDEFIELKRQVQTIFYDITDEVVANIRATLSPIGWTTAQDIALATGYRGVRIYVAISMMDDVISRDNGAYKAYMIQARA